MKIEHSALLKKQTNHNFSIDFLRVVATYMIITVHLLNQGGIISNSSSGIYGAILWLIYILARGGSDIFALISGYMGYEATERPCRYTKLIDLWFQVAFYGLILTLIMKFGGFAPVGIKTVIKAVLPVTFCQYWYFTAYVGVFIFMPWMNQFIRRLSNLEAVCLGTAIIVLSAYAAMARNIGQDLFYLNSGYSFLWLFAVYLVGAVIRKIDLISKCRNIKIIWAVFCGCVLFTWIWKLVVPALPAHFLGIAWKENAWTALISPTILGKNICVLLLFVQFKLNGQLQKWSALLAPATFGVYLIHVQPLVYSYVIGDCLAWTAGVNPIIRMLIVFGAAFAVLIAGAGIDKCRTRLFQVMQVHTLSMKLESIGALVCNKYIKEVSRKFE